MPLPIELAHALTRRLALVREKGIIPYLLPDGKAQVTVEYQDDTPVRIQTVVVSSQHEENVTIERLREDIIRHVIRPVLPGSLLDDSTQYFINPTDYHKLLHRLEILSEEISPKITIHNTLITTFGLVYNEYSGVFSNIITLEDLFAE